MHMMLTAPTAGQRSDRESGRTDIRDLVGDDTDAAALDGYPSFQSFPAATAGPGRRNQDSRRPGS